MEKGEFAISTRFCGQPRKDRLVPAESSDDKGMQLPKAPGGQSHKPFSANGPATRAVLARVRRRRETESSLPTLPRLARVAAIACAALALIGPPASSAATLSSEPDATSTTDNAVLSVARAGDTIYLGGYFDSIAERTGGLVTIDPSSAEIDTNMPKIGGGAELIPDGAGGWYAFGVFSHIGGVERENLAHILPDRTVDQDWVADVTSVGLGGDAVVADLAVGPDGTLYISGRFDRVNGVPRFRLAAIDPDTGQVTSWNPQANGAVGAVDFAADGTVYVSGQFTEIGANGAARTYLAALDPQTANATGWNPSATPQPNTDYPSSVGELAVGQDGTVYAGGYFATIGANHATRNNLAAIDPASGNATGWNPSPNFYIYDLALGASGTVYAAGGFTTIGANGASRRYLAAIDPASGNATSWNPNPDQQLTYLTVGPGGLVYASGAFTTIGVNQVARPGVAALDPNTSAATDWNPDVTGACCMVFGPDGKIYATVEAIHPVPRQGLAALDASDGSVKPWAPNPNNTVSAITVGGNGTVYVGGDFTSIGANQLARNRIAALDPVSGNATSWNPNANATVYALKVAADGTVYAGGGFETIGANSQLRNGLAALDPATGNATLWNPDPHTLALPGSIRTLALGNEGTVYAGGTFTTIGGQPRQSIAALDPSSGLATSWSPDARGGTGAVGLAHVLSIALSPDKETVYAGGDFTTIGANDAARRNLAALNADTANASSWNPSPTSDTATDVVFALATAPDGTVYAGGDFRMIGANQLSRNALAALDPVTGNATSFDPGLDRGSGPTIVQALATAADGTLYLGGYFLSTDYAGGQHGYASFGPATLPRNTVAPHITGTPRVGERLRCTSGAWEGGQSQTYAYEWRRDGSPIAGGDTYTAISADGGHSLSCRVTATNAAGSAAANTAPVSIPVQEDGGVGGTSGVGSGAPIPGAAPVPSGGERKTGGKLRRCKRKGSRKAGRRGKCKRRRRHA
jgi:hypothetical protein